ncbi:hypothetical protein EC150222_05090 [Escherichia coli O145:H28]|nr:hypothetical protein EC150222_05090 [Escherichia coli O145:H28]
MIVLIKINTFRPPHLRRTSGTTHITTFRIAAHQTVKIPHTYPAGCLFRENKLPAVNYPRRLIFAARPRKSSGREMEVRRRSLNGRPRGSRCTTTESTANGAADTPDNAHHGLFKQDFCHHGQHRTGESPPVCLCTGQHRRHILCNTVKGLRGSTFNLRKTVRRTFRPLAPAGLQPGHPASTKLLLRRPGVLQCRCGLRQRSRIITVHVPKTLRFRLPLRLTVSETAGFCADGGLLRALLLFKPHRLLCQLIQAFLVFNLVAQLSQLAFVLQRLVFMRQQGFFLLR